MQPIWTYSSHDHGIALLNWTGQLSRKLAHFIYHQLFWTFNNWHTRMPTSKQTHHMLIPSWLNNDTAKDHSPGCLPPQYMPAPHAPGILIIPLGEQMETSLTGSFSYAPPPTEASHTAANPKTKRSETILYPKRHNIHSPPSSNEPLIFFFYVFQISRCFLSLSLSLSILTLNVLQSAPHHHLSILTLNVLQSSLHHFSTVKSTLTHQRKHVTTPCTHVTFPPH